MKKKNLSVTLAIIAFVLFFGNNLKAQYVLDNQLLCDIKVTYEMFDGNCDVCSFATITILAGNSVTLNNCGGLNDLCVIIQSVGGNNITWYNHANLNASCHGPLGITAQSSTGQCSGGWNVTMTPGSSGAWTIF